jgi:hypothetical protein
MANLTRRTLTRARAAIFSSLSRMVAQVALAKRVCARPMRRSAQSKPQPESLGAHGGGAGAVCQHIQLNFLDAVWRTIARCIAK